MNKLGLNKTNFWYSRELALLALLFILMVSLLMFFFDTHRKNRSILFFPEDNLVEVSGDFHILPLKNSIEENMKVLLAEALLDPFDFRLNKTVPEDVIINSFIYDREIQTLYVDLSIEMIRVDSDTPSVIDERRMLEILEKNLTFNFRKLEIVKFTIDGEVPFSPVFSENEQ